jgi:hypothetical protein
MNPEIVVFILRILMALLLIGFLTAILFYLWKDTRKEDVGETPLPLAHLTRLDMELGAAFLLKKVNLLGRAEDNQILLDESTVSAYHARLSFQQGQWWLEDLGSRNGTKLNGIEVAEPLVITYGDRIQLGRVELQFSAGPGQPVKED